MSQDNDALRDILRDVGVTMASFKTSLLKHAISFDDVTASLKKMESAMAENNDKLDRMLAVRGWHGRSPLTPAVPSRRVALFLSPECCWQPLYSL